MTQNSSTERLQQTPLHAMHLDLTAKMVPFAGYDMPLHYRAGLLKEHLHTRSGAGLFDVSHMGQLSVPLRGRNAHEVARALETLVPIDIVDLPVGRQRYGLLLSETGGILDDLMVTRLDMRFLVVVNAANKLADLAYLRSKLPAGIALELRPDALIALQGPQAEDALAQLAPAVRDMVFMDAREIEVMGAACVITRSGYTGEDGFELSIPVSNAEPIVQALLAMEDVLPVGLGARDSLRLEAGLCLHGADVDADTNPVEASLAWAIPPVRRSGGEREGGFPAANRILDQIEHGASRRRVGLRTEDRLLVRASAPLFEAEDAVEPFGKVTSGGFGPSLQAPVAMGYVPAKASKPGTRVFAEVRGRRLPLTVCSLPFVPAHFRRRETPA